MSVRSISIAKAGKSIDVDFDALPKASQEYIITYGLTQTLNDAHSQVTVKDLTGDKLEKARADAFAWSEKKLVALKAGEVSLRTRESDPVAAEMRRMASRIVAEALAKKHGVTVSAASKRDDFTGYVTRYLEANGGEESKLRIAAAKVVAERNALDVDLDDVLGDEPEPVAA